MKSNIVLIGMPGSGKSTIGRRLAEELNMTFLDADLLLEKQANLAIQDIVNLRGLKYFRALEESVLSSIECSNTVIATGGSAIYSDLAMQHLGESGVRVYLRISLETMLRRIDNQGERGLVKLASLPLQGLYQQRASLYPKAADIIVENNAGATDLFFDQLKKSLSDYAQAQ